MNLVATVSSPNKPLEVGPNIANIHAGMNTVWLLCIREWRRMMMEPSRVLGVMLQPLLFLFVFGVGFDGSFFLEGRDVRYISFFYPGILGLVVLFASIYATLTLVEDKKCGFFRLILCGPGGVGFAVLGKVLATAILGFMQGLLFFLLLPFLSIKLSFWSVVASMVWLLLGALCFSVMGVLCAWISPSSSSFHALMSIVLIPMWLLSGAMFPVEKGAFYWLSFVNPMSYFVDGLRAILIDNSGQPNVLGLFIFLALLSVTLMVVSRRRSCE